MIKQTGWVRVWLHNNGRIHFSALHLTKTEALNLQNAEKKHAKNRRLIGVKKVNIVEGCGLKNYKFPVNKGLAKAIKETIPDRFTYVDDGTPVFPGGSSLYMSEKIP